MAFNAAFVKQRLDWESSVELYARPLRVTGGKERIRHYLVHYNTTFQASDDLDGFIAGLNPAKMMHYTRMLSEGRILMRPDVCRLLDEARTEGLRRLHATARFPL